MVKLPTVHGVVPYAVITMSGYMDIRHRGGRRIPRGNLDELAIVPLMIFSVP